MRISDILETRNYDTTHPVTNADLNDLFGDNTIDDDGHIMVRNNMVGYILDDGGVIDMRGDIDKHIGWMVENASVGATSAGGIATSVGGFGSTQKRDYSASIYTNETETSHPVTNNDLSDTFGNYKIFGGKITVNNKLVGYITADGGVVDIRGDADNHIGWLVENK